MDFEAITTQEAFDAAVNERIESERTAIRGEFKDYEKIKKDLINAQEQLKERDNTIAGLNSQINGYKVSAAKMRIAQEAGLPIAMANRLTGETDDDIRKDAAELVKLIGKQTHPAPPLASTEPATEDKNKADLKGLLEKLKER